jgi:hypothetical protein
MNYQTKYLKYKLKYLNIKNKIINGGSKIDINYNNENENESGNESDNESDNQSDNESGKSSNKQKKEIDPLFNNPTLPKNDIKGKLYGFESDANPTLPRKTIDNEDNSEIDIDNNPVINQKIVNEENPTLPNKSIK